MFRPRVVSTKRKTPSAPSTVTAEKQPVNDSGEHTQGPATECPQDVEQSSNKRQRSKWGPAVVSAALDLECKAPAVLMLHLRISTNF